MGGVPPGDQRPVDALPGGYPAQSKSIPPGAQPKEAAPRLQVGLWEGSSCTERGNIIKARR